MDENKDSKYYLKALPEKVRFYRLYVNSGKICNKASSKNMIISDARLSHL